MIRYLRTTVFPFPINIEKDAERGDDHSSFDTNQPEYFVPPNVDICEWMVRLEFKDRNGAPLFVVCPAYPFLGCENPSRPVDGGYGEGLCFVAKPEWNICILGAVRFLHQILA